MSFATRKLPPAATATVFQSAEHTDFVATEGLWIAEKHLRAYNGWIVKKLARYFTPPGAVLEFGAGVGTLAALWEETTGTKPECIEIDPKMREMLKNRTFVCFDAVASVTRKYDYVYSSNVLDHIEDDVAALRQIYGLLNHRAYLALHVPAFMCLYSAFDASIGHYRRYGKKELTDKLRQAGFTVIESRYFDSVGFFASLAMKWRGYNVDNVVGNEKNLRIYNRYIYPASKMLDAIGCRFLLGKNILAIARKMP